jgi:hypothetical protein
LATRLSFVLTLTLLACADVCAQTVELAVDYERRYDRYTYRFENPSRFDTAALVPHFFEQRYVADNNWLRATAGYRVGTTRLETRIAIAPSIVTTADDFDTFFQPSGDVVVAGTAGDATLSSLRLRQRVFLSSGRRFGLHAVYAYSRDRARYHEGNKLVTHTLPPSADRSVVTTRETTWSDVHEFHVGVEAGRGLGRWRLTGHAAAGPGIAQLTVQLPDKYPGVDLRFRAAIVNLTTGASLQRPVGPLVLRTAIDYALPWSMRGASILRRSPIGVSIGLGWSR